MKRIIEGGSAATIYNITMTSADTEYFQALPKNTKKVEFRCRGEYDIRYAFEAGKVKTPVSPYRTLKSKEVKSEWNLTLSGQTLYVACADAGQVVELEVWV